MGSSVSKTPNHFFTQAPHLLLVGIAGLLLQSCGGAHMPLPALTTDPTSSASSGAASGGLGLSNPKRVAVTFQEVKPIFKRACQTCHSPGGSLPSWTDYATAYRLRARIFDRVVVKKNMPMGATLPAADIALIAQWVQSGAVESNPDPVESGPNESSGTPAAPSGSEVPSNEIPSGDPASTAAPEASDGPPPAVPLAARCEDQAPSYQGGTPSLSGTVEEQYARGQAGYVKYSCATCHGATGRGDGPAAVAYNPKPRNFWTEDFKRGSRPAEILATVSTGFCSMPGFEAAIPEIERMEIATFIAGLRQNDPAAQKLLEPPAPPPQNSKTSKSVPPPAGKKNGAKPGSIQPQKSPRPNR